jgi:hypothetical protein
MTQFIFLLLGILSGALLVFILPFKRHAQLIGWTVFFVLLAFGLSWYVTYRQTPDFLTVFPDPVFLPNYYENQHLSLVDKLKISFVDAVKTYVYGYVGLALSLYFRGRDRLKEGKRKKAPGSKGLPKSKKGN